MQLAPYLLQAFAARILATRQEATVSKLDLLKQGYDVETLVEMIGAYNALPEESRGFVVEATELQIFMKRKAEARIPTVELSPLPAPKAAPPNEQASAKPPTLMRALTSSRAAAPTPSDTTIILTPPRKVRPRPKITLSQRGQASDQFNR